MAMYWRVMLGPKSAHAGECFSEGFIGANYDLAMDLSDSLVEDWREFNSTFRPLLLEQQPGRSAISAGLAAAQTWTVAKGIHDGDVVIAPDGKGNYRGGVVTGPYRYVPDSDLPHQRPVNWDTATFSRSSMSDELQGSTRSTHTAVQLATYGTEVDRLRSGQAPTVEIIGGETIENPMEFAVEKHLEEFLVANWTQTALGAEYDILELDGEQIGQQYQSDTGPIDILALSKDGKTYLVVELKKGRASDQVVGQILRYMGFVKASLADEKQEVRGAIVALADDKKFVNALAMVPSVSFYRYRVDFKLESTE